MTKFISWLLISGVLLGFWPKPEEVFAAAKLKYPAPTILDTQYALRDESAPIKAEDGSITTITGLITVINYIHMNRAAYDRQTRELIETDEEDPNAELCDDQVIQDCPFSGYYEMEDVYIVLKWTDKNGDIGLFHRLQDAPASTTTKNGGSPLETVNLYELSDDYYECTGSNCADAWNDQEKFSENYVGGKFTTQGDNFSDYGLRLEQHGNGQYNYESVVTGVQYRVCQSIYTPHLDTNNTKINLNSCEDKEGFARFKSQNNADQRNNKLRRGLSDQFDKEWGSYIYLIDSKGGNTGWINYYIRDINKHLNGQDRLTMEGGWPKDETLPGGGANSYKITNAKLTDMSSLTSTVDYCRSDKTGDTSKDGIDRSSLFVEPISQDSAFGGANPRERIRNFALQLLEKPTLKMLEDYQKGQSQDTLPLESEMLKRLKDDAFINDIIPDETTDMELYHKFYQEGYGESPRPVYPDRFPRQTYLQELRDYYLQAVHLNTNESFQTLAKASFDEVITEDENAQAKASELDTYWSNFLLGIGDLAGLVASIAYVVAFGVGVAGGAVASGGLAALAISAAGGPTVIVGAAICVVALVASAILAVKAAEKLEEAKQQYNKYISAYMRILITEYYVTQNSNFRKCIDKNASTDEATQNFLNTTMYSKDALTATSEMAQDLSKDEAKARELGKKLADQIFSEPVCGKAQSNPFKPVYWSDIAASFFCSTGMLLSKLKYPINGLINQLLRAISSWRDGALGRENDEEDATDTP